MIYLVVISILVIIINLVVGLLCDRAPFLSRKEIMLSAASAAITGLLAIYISQCFFSGNFLMILFVSFLFLLIPVFAIKLFKRKPQVIKANFFGYGKHIYKTDLGFRKDMIKDARKTKGYDVFVYYILDNLMDILFFDPSTNYVYGLLHENDTIVIRFCENQSINKWINNESCTNQMREVGSIIYSTNDTQDLWSGIHFNGESLETVLFRSYIVHIE